MSIHHPLASVKSIDFLVECILNNIEYNGDTFVYMFGPSAMGKTRVATVLARLFGPYENLTQLQLEKDLLGLDDVAREGARCILLDEYGVFPDDHQLFRFQCTLKHILCGTAFKVRTNKSGGGRNVRRLLRVDLVICTSNFDPSTSGIFHDAAVCRRTIAILCNERMENYEINAEVLRLRNKYHDKLKERMERIQRDLQDAYD